MPISKMTRAVRELLMIVERLHRAYPARKFTLDGRIVGDIGEVLVNEAYAVSLYKVQTPHYDGETSTGRKVQIKATMRKTFTFPVGYTPERYIAVKIDGNGRIAEIFNGPGKDAEKAIRKRSRPNVGYHVVGASALAKVNKGVAAVHRIRLRRGAAYRPDISTRADGKLPK